jgi:hypothetical protein
MSHSLRTVLTQSVVQKLADVGSTNAIDKYTTLLSACAADDVVNALEKKLLREYAISHKISDEMHEKCLGRIGWTPSEFHRGMKAGRKDSSEGWASKASKKTARVEDF